MMHKAWCNVEEVPYNFSRLSCKFQGHMGWKINHFNPIWVRLLGRSQLSNPLDLPCFITILIHKVIYICLQLTTFNGMVQVRYSNMPAICVHPYVPEILLSVWCGQFVFCSRVNQNGFGFRRRYMFAQLIRLHELNSALHTNLIYSMLKTKKLPDKCFNP